MSDFEKQLATVRPRIEKISPIAGYAVLGFGVLNVLLGLSLFTLTARFAGGIAILNYIFNYQLWGVLFFGSGAALLWGYYRNDWHLMRRSLLVTLFFKLVWLLALAFRFFSGSYSNNTILLIWGFITYVQILVYIYFLPIPPKGTGNE